jgi:hypothetical protein
LGDGRVLGLEEVSDVEADEGVRARDGDGEWRRREGGVAGERRAGGGESGGEGDSSGAVMRVIGDEVAGEVVGFEVWRREERKGALGFDGPPSVGL